jgi:hypothetical protein
MKSRPASLQKKAQRVPYRVRLPVFINEDVGLGDAVRRVTQAIGVQPCDRCHQRAATLNRWVVFSRYR